MVESRHNPVADAASADMHWKELYRIGGIIPAGMGQIRYCTKSAIIPGSGR
jgi:hypothetical protein